MNVTFCVHVFGDYVLVLIDLNTLIKKTDNFITKRDWTNYTPKLINNNLLNMLNQCSIDWCILNVQDHWNALEDIIINGIDEVAPLNSFKINPAIKTERAPN